MPQLLWEALAHGLTRPVAMQDVPAWFAALLLLGFAGGGALITMGVIQGCRGTRRHRRSTPAVPIDHASTIYEEPVRARQSASASANPGPRSISATEFPRRARASSVALLSTSKVKGSRTTP
jgi:hypothetical protein